ncbi:MAG: peptidyl-prolyl cis-trans isomerase, partial [Candidatus Cloacimonadaceae bacterium]|nr:peptidyl-prolyl cis-trans isomerase [Candidatus Cloacimonadaceae bacterium]
MKRLLLIPLIIVMLLALSCKKDQVKGTPLAQVNDDILSLEGFSSTFGEEEWNSLSPEQKKKYVEDWVNITLLAREADAIGLGKEPATLQRIDYATKKIKANALIGQKLSQIQVTEDQLFNYYRIHQADFTKNMMEYNVQRIYVKDKIAAEALYDKLSSGTGFDEAVFSYSQEPLRENLGNMGFVNAKSADSLFWQAARKLKDKEIGLMPHADGWYIVRHTATREGTEPAGFEE